MDNSKYILLLHKKLSSGLTVEEEKTFLELSQSFSTERVANDIERIWDVSKNYRQDYEPNVDQALARFKSRLAQEEMPNAVPQDTTAKVVPMHRRRFTRLAVAASVAVVLAAGWMMGWFGGSSQMVTAYNDTAAPLEVRLEDGSVVWLNQKSTLSYPESFGWGDRQVSLDGEGYFEVESDRNHPFIVATNHGSVKVLGTAFNIRSVAGEKTEEVFVTEGIVEYLASSNQKTTLTKNQKAVFDHEKRNLRAKPVRHSNDLSWMTNEIDFASSGGVPLREAITTIERHYNITIQTKDIARILDCPCTLSFKNSSVEEAIKVIAEIFILRYQKIDNRTFRFYGGGQCS